MTDRLLKERPGILNWAIDGLDRLRKRGYFLQPDSGKALLDDLHELSSPVGQFARDCCVLAPIKEIGCRELFNTWKQWCELQGRDHVGTVQSFGRNLQAAFPEIRTRRPSGTDARRRVYQGVSLNEDVKRKGLVWESVSSAMVRGPVNCTRTENDVTEDGIY